MALITWKANFIPMRVNHVEGSRFKKGELVRYLAGSIRGGLNFQQAYPPKMARRCLVSTERYQP